MTSFLNYVTATLRALFAWRGSNVRYRGENDQQILKQFEFYAVLFRLVVSMVYYGLSLNSGNLAGDFYLNIFLSGVVEFPAYTLCLVLLDRVGRKKLHATCMIMGGLACISTIFPVLYLDKCELERQILCYLVWQTLTHTK